MSASFPLNPGSARHEVHTLLGHQLDKLQAAFTLRESSAKRIHRVRKLLRALRATLRLVHHALPRARATSWKHQLRTAARDLSPLRDQDALLDRLQEWTSGISDATAALRGVRRRLRSAILAQAGSHGPSQIQTLASVHRRLRSLARQHAGLTIHDSWSRALQGHLRCVERERSAWKALQRDSDDAHWHRWRRRCKDLDHQFRVLEPLCPPLTKAWSSAWHQVSDLLGEIHDGSMLDAIIRPLQTEALPMADLVMLQELRAALTHRRQQAERMALRLGRQLHAQSESMGKTLFRRWRHLWLAGPPLTSPP